MSTDRIKEIIKGATSHIDPRQYQLTQTYYNVRKFLKDNNLVLATADKGETLVILTRVQYEQKMVSFLHQSGATTHNYSTKTNNTNTRKLTQDAQYVITGSRERRERQFYIQNPALPKIYGTIKTHKSDFPIRPVVAFFTDPTYKLAKYLADWFRLSSGFNPSYTVKNSAELAGLLHPLKFPPTAKLISLDAVSMFTRVPVARTIAIMIDMLERKNISPPIVAEFRTLLNHCTERNICVFQGSVYRFPDGLPMGGPLSMLMADVFMDSLETELLLSSPNTPNIRFWRRYVDDVICVWAGNEPDAQSLLDDLNNFDPGFDFTLEFGGQSLNYLDLHISLIEQHNILRTSVGIYRKSSYTGVSIHASSLHPET